MRQFSLQTLTFILLTVSAVCIHAAEPVSANPSDREKALQAEISKIEAQLNSAQQTIADLQSELDASRRELAATQQTLAEQKTPAEQPTPQAQSEAVPLVKNTAASQIGMLKSDNVQAAVRPADQKQPLSITSLSPEELALGGVEDLSRLEYLVPGFRYGQTGHDARISMRGARTNHIGPEGESVVGVFEDGIFLPTSTVRVDSFLDVERIDVLRGPQISEFGQQAYAGAVSIVSNKPDFDGFYGYAQGENAIPDRTRWELVLNVPINDTLALRVAGLSESRSGYIENFVIDPDADDLADRKEQTIRSSLLWQPTENFSILLWRRYQDENGAGSGPWGYQQLGAYANGEFQAGNQFAPEGFTPDISPYKIYRNFIAAAEFEHELDTLDLNWDFGPAKLRWLSNYSDLEGVQTYDSDYSDQGEFLSSDFSGWSSNEKNWSSELRLSSNGRSALDWTVGLYWLERDSDWGWLATFNGVNFQPDWDVQGTYSTKTQAAFAQLSYPLGERFSVTGGLRWNEESKTMRTGEKGKWDDVLWKAALQFDIDDRTMTYLSASTGYLPGGINTAPGVNPVWEPEELTALEAGLQTQSASGDLSLDLSVWYNDFTDVQSQSFLVQPFPGSPEATEYTGNGGAMDAKGLEAKIRWNPLPQWNLSTNIAYTDAKFGDYTTANLEGLGDIPGHTQGSTLSFDGWRPALSPKWVVGLQTSYVFNFGKWGTLTPYLQTTYASSYYASDINLAGARQDSHTRTDLRFIWQPIPRFQVQYYFLNNTDTESLSWARVYNPAARPDITTVQANWNNRSTQGIIFDITF